MKVLQKITMECEDGATFMWSYVDVEDAEPPQPAPEIPPPVWDKRPVSGDACAAATKALCG